MTIEIQPAAFNRKQAARYLGLSENTLVKLIQSGRVKQIKIDRRVIIAKAELDRFLEGEVLQ